MAFDKEDWGIVGLGLLLCILVLRTSSVIINTSTEPQQLLLATYITVLALVSVAVVARTFYHKNRFSPEELFRYGLVTLVGLLLAQSLFPGIVGPASVFIAPLTQSIIPFNFALFG